MDNLEKKLSDLKNVTDIQRSSGNWNHDPYMHGMANGLILAKSIMDGAEPEYLEAPKDGWLKDRSAHEPLEAVASA